MVSTCNLLNFLGRCTDLQFVQSMEFDPKTQWMWIIDTGRLNTITDTPINNCPAKLIIWDTKNNELVLHNCFHSMENWALPFFKFWLQVQRHDFPEEVVGYEVNFLNDIMVDPVDGKWAFMSDNGIGPISGNAGGIIVYDFEYNHFLFIYTFIILPMWMFRNNESWRLEDPTMNPDPAYSNFEINGEQFSLNSPVNGISLTPDGEYLFFTPLTGRLMYRLSTKVAKVFYIAKNIFWAN